MLVPAGPAGTNIGVTAEIGGVLSTACTDERVERIIEPDPIQPPPGRGQLLRGEQFDTTMDSSHTHLPGHLQATYRGRVGVVDDPLEGVARKAAVGSPADWPPAHRGQQTR